jgi:quinol monooxygenase YgiN
MKFARNVQFEIKNGKENEFNRIFKDEILPMLRKQNGFKEELTLVHENKAMGISLWDNKTSAETYRTNTYPEIVKKLTPFIEGTPRVETYDVGLTTLAS